MADKTIFDLLKGEKSLEKISQLDSFNVAGVNEEGQSPLHLAVLNNNIEVAALLLQKGFNPNQKDNNQLSPLIASAANGLDEMFELLLLYHPDLKQVNRFGGTALLPSSEKGFIKVVQKALDAGVPVNHQNRLGWTALLEAVILGNEGFLFRDIIEELVSHGADVKIKDFDSLSGIDYAEKRNSQFILPILEKEITEKEMTENEKEQECCEEYEVHENMLEIVKRTMPEEEELNDLAELFKIFGDATRIRILFVLFEAEVCVCDLAALVGSSSTWAPPGPSRCRW